MNNSISHKKILPKLKQAEASVPSAVSNDTGRNYTIPDEKHNRFYVPLFTYIYVLFGCVFLFLLFISMSWGKCYHFIYFSNLNIPSGNCSSGGKSFSSGSFGLGWCLLKNSTI